MSGCKDNNRRKGQRKAREFIKQRDGELAHIKPGKVSRLPAPLQSRLRHDRDNRAEAASVQCAVRRAISQSGEPNWIDKSDWPAWEING